MKEEAVPSSVNVWLNVSSHMMLASCKREVIICIQCASHTGPMTTAKACFFSYIAEYANHSPLFQTYTAKTYKPSWVHEIWMISWWILCTKASLWLLANIANTDLTAELGPWEENETRLVKTATEREWLQGSVFARKVIDNHNVRVEMPDKSNWLRRFKHIMIGCTKSSPL